MEGGSTTNITETVVQPTQGLAKVFQQYELWGVLSFFCVLLVVQFLLFMWKLKGKDKDIEKLTTSFTDRLDLIRKEKDQQVKEMMDDFSEQAAEYGKLLENRHEQFCKVLERAVLAMQSMTASSDKVEKQLVLLLDTVHQCQAAIMYRNTEETHDYRRIQGSDSQPAGEGQGSTGERK